jgi:hypothetical protein
MDCEHLVDLNAALSSENMDFVSFMREPHSKEAFLSGKTASSKASQNGY